MLREGSLEGEAEKGGGARWARWEKRGKRGKRDREKGEGKYVRNGRERVAIIVSFSLKLAWSKVIFAS